MDENTTVVLTLQLVALFSIAGALLLYLLCKIRTGVGSDLMNGTCPGACKPVLVTSADNAVGLQISIHLANRGFRVFAGLKDQEADDSTSAKVIRSWQKYRESIQGPGILIPLPLDVSREDLLHEAADIIRAHLPAGEDGIWAIVNTSGLSYRGRLDQQDITHWDAMLRTNVVGVFRVIRKFQQFLRNASGRIITIGATENLGTGLVAYNASRYAVEGASKALRHELSPMGIKVVTMNLHGIMPELLFSTPKTNKKEEKQEASFVEMSSFVDYQPLVLSPRALQILDVALTTRNPKANYCLEEKRWWKNHLEYGMLLRIIKK